MRLTTVCIFLLLLLTGCYQQTNQQTTESTVQTSTEQTSPETTVPDKDAMSDKEAFAADAFQQVQSGTAILVDVRSDEEWNESHFEVAKHIPIDKIKEEPEVAFESIDKEQTVFLHWRAGGRAGRAAKMLMEKGYNAIQLNMKYETIKAAGFEESTD